MTKYRALLVLGLLLVARSVSAEFKSDFVEVKKQGMGPDVVLIHGFTCSSSVWKDVVSKLEKNYTFHLVQIKGFAGTKAPKSEPKHHLTKIRDELIRYIEAEKLKRPQLVGHSLGGLTSVRMAAKAPKLIGKVIVVDSLPFFSLIYNPAATVESTEPIAQAMEKQFLSLADDAFKLQATQGVAILTKSEAKKKQLAEWATSTNRKVYARIMRELLTHDSRDEIKTVKCPVTVLFAFDDTAGVSEARVKALYDPAYAKLKGVQLKGIKDSYHFIMWDQPKVFLDTITKELESGR